MHQQSKDKETCQSQNLVILKHMLSPFVKNIKCEESTLSTPHEIMGTFAIISIKESHVDIQTGKKPGTNRIYHTWCKSLFSNHRL
jgi:hypothetical protein